MVGGFAIRFHGYNRATDDLDMWIEDTVTNRRNLRKAFAILVMTILFPSRQCSLFEAGPVFTRQVLNPIS